MPITQDRIRKLIMAGIEFQAIINRIRQSTDANTPADLYADIHAITPAEHYASLLLNEEQTRYNLTHTRNALKRDYMRRKRADTPGPIHPPMPGPKLRPTEPIDQAGLDAAAALAKQWLEEADQGE